MTEKILESVNGYLRFANSFTVSPRTTPEEIVQYFGRENVSINDIKTGWKHYSVRNVKINDSYFIITFYFDKDILKMLEFIVSDKLTVAVSRYDLSEKKELQNLEYFNDWLTKEIGNKRQFTWGTVNSFYDCRGGFSSIVLHYK